MKSVANMNTAARSDTIADVTRDKLVMVRLTEEERKAWQAAADADQRKLADWIRVVVNAALPAKPRKAKR